MYINKIHISLEEQAEQEYTNSMVEKQQADIDYIAMMTDVDIPTEEVTENVSED